MNGFSIKTKITALTGLCLVVALTSTLVLLWRMEAHTKRDQEALTSHLRQMELARVQQLNLKKQVQEWKNLLLRGHNAGDFEKSHGLFLKQESLVQENGKALSGSLTQPSIRAKVDEFLKAHEELGRRYRSALAVFEQSGRLDYQSADRLVIGIDRGPTDLIDEIIGSLANDFGHYTTFYNAVLLNDQRYMVLVSLIVFLGLMVASTLITRRITSPIHHLAQTMAKISTGKDYSLRAVRSSRDELGLLTDGFNEMLAQIQQQHAALQQSRDDLEGRVAERTMELAKTNAALSESQGLYHSLVEHLPANVWRKDAEGRFSFVNSRFCRSKGKTADEILGQTASAINSKEVADQVTKEHELIMRTGKSIEKEESYPQPDGTVQYLQILKSPVLAADGRVIGSQGIQFDITARKRTEEQLRVQTTALDAAANPIVITDHDGTIQSVNPAFTALTGYTAQEAVGQNPRFLKGGKQDDASYRKLWQTISSGQVWNGELTNRRKDGSFYAEEMTITPVRNAEGVIVRYIAIQHDITARKELEAQMERLRTEHALILNSIGEGVHWIDTEGRIKFENPAAAKMLGYQVSELIGKPAHATMHHTRADGAAYPQSECPIYATARDGVVRRVTGEVFWRKDGSSFAVEYVCTPVSDMNGHSGGSVVIFTDITERKRAEEIIRRERDFSQASVDSLPGLFYLFDDQGRFLRWNKNLEKVSGYSAAEFPQMTPLDLIDKTDKGRIADVIQRVFQTGEATVEVDVLSKDQTRTPFFFTGKLFHFDQKSCVIGMGIDITERKLAEAKLAETHKQLVVASRQAGMAEVATGVLHNVGNVLNSVNVSATLVADHVRHTQAANIAKVAALFDQHKADLAGFLTKDHRGQMLPGYLGTLAEALAAEQKTLLEELDHLRKNIEHIKTIVTMQQSYAKTSGFIETIPLADLVEEALRMNASSLARHDVELVRDFQIRPAISTDKHKVVQLLINLVRNAKFACDEAGRTDKRITVRIAGDAQRVRVSIIDNGIGIPAENLTLIFNHGFTTRKGGHGFGLHSGALAARELGGSLTVQSDGPGKGAVFTLEMPLAVPQPPV